MTGKLQAAIFDVDGMLLDTHEFIFQAFEHSLRTHGHTVPNREEMTLQIGRSLADCYAAFAPDGNFMSLRNTHMDFQSSNIELITAYEGLTEMLDTLKSAGLKLGVFSSRWGNLLPSLNHTGITHYFDTIIDGQRVTHHKPHPEGIKTALEEIDIPAHLAAMIGDAPVDIEAGRAADVAVTIGITHGFGTRKDLIAAKPDFIVDSLAEIPPLLLNMETR